MEDQNQREFAWTTLFLVTGASFLCFGFILNLIDTAGGHVILFNRIGICSILMGIFSFINLKFGKKETRPSHTPSKRNR